MLNYKECTDEKFREAMETVKRKPLTLIPTDLLYIAFTKYHIKYNARYRFNM